jgi:glycerate 2-kinase
MATEIESVLAGRIASGESRHKTNKFKNPAAVTKNFSHLGILSVPVGATKYHSLSQDTKMRVVEGAAGNLPDNDSLSAAEKIKSHILTLTHNDILLCLITGGGSSLLSLPLAPITLDEKSTLIKRLSRAGATINELNVVRIAISQVKGGKLAAMAKNAHKIISLIISDIINDPLELIASGPTIPYSGTASPLHILEKYGLMGTLPSAIAQVLAQQRNEDNQDARALINNQVFLIGSNRIAVEAAMDRARTYNLVPVLLSVAVQGNVIDISEAFFDLVCATRAYSSLSRDEFINSLGRVLGQLNAQTDFVADLIEALNQSVVAPNAGICIVSGGEPTVVVTGEDGLGGRNQELALRFTKLCADSGTNDDDLLFLSAGSDGIDGNNDAAGALGGTRILSPATRETLSDVMSDYIYRNDSYRFYKKHAGDGHIHTGITGTNIMDIHLLMIMPKARLS